MLRSVLPAAFLLAAAASAQAPPGYYASVDASSAASLRTSLHAVIDDHTSFPYTAGSTDTWDVLEQADEDPTNGGRILDLYRNASYAKAGGGNSNYNREHTWPKSYGFPDEGSSNYPHNDCHQLYLSDIAYNGSRGNRPFGTCSVACDEEPTLFNAGMGGGSGTYPGNSNWTSDGGTLGTWETWGERKGDVARALLYLDVRYEGGLHGGTGQPEPDLVLTDDLGLIASSNTGSNLSTAYMGRLSTLLAWHAADPVDALEAARNDEVFSFQGNRNPFVDHPEWVDCLFAGSCDGGPIGGGGDAWINELHYDDASGDLNERVEVAGAAGASLAGWTLVLYNGATGAPYQTLNLSGTFPDQGGCVGALSFSASGLQNGAPDGLALVDDQGAVVEFLSYEGTFTAASGVAMGATSVDIGVSESNGTPAGTALGLVGTGSTRADFVWAAALADSVGAPNPGQTFAGGCPQPPAAPVNLVASAQDAAVSLAWTANAEPDVVGYDVRRATTGGGPYATVVSAHPTTSYVDGGLANGTTYFYVVAAVASSGLESADSAEDAATPVDQVAPLAPTGLVLTPGSAQVELVWNANAEGDLDHYAVSRADSFFGPYVEVATPVAAAYTDAGLVNGVTYWYAVRAVDTSGNVSGATSPASATPTGSVTPVETFRNGSVPNPAVFTGGVSGGPVVGTTWDPVVAPFLAGAVAHFVLVQPDGLALDVPSPFGTLLVNVPTPDLVFFAAPGAPFAVPIPNDPGLPGLAPVTQGGALAPGPVIQLANALDLVLGG